MKMTFISVLIALLLLQCTTSQEVRNTLKPSDFQALNGRWTGSLTYLDYTSGEPYTMPADLEITQTNNAVYLTSLYPDEPHANSTDTLILSNDGRKWGDDSIVSYLQFENIPFQLITERQGTDGNDNSPALMRHTYTLSTTGKFSIRKDVKFDGTENWIMRHEYVYRQEK